jgi:ATP-dependent Clp protease ATP-binding subunit ClpA
MSSELHGPDHYSATKAAFLLHQIGSPPGYCCDEGGQLTSQIQHNPYTVILVDEIERAAPQFIMVFLQVLDDGRLTDGQGETMVFIVHLPYIML